MKKRIKQHVKEIILFAAVIYIFDVVFLLATHTKPIMPLWKNIVTIVIGLIISRVIISAIKGNKK